MADSKISDLAAVVTPASTDELAVNQGGTSKKVTRAQMHALESGEHFTVPQVNEAATPTIAFGDGDTGFYEGADDALNVSMAGVHEWQWDDSKFGGVVAGSGGIANVDATDTVPTLLPTGGGDEDTGIGSVALDSLSLIASGVEAVRYTGDLTDVLVSNEINVGLTADVGSAQGNGVITSSFNVYSTVGTAGDAATLPATFPVGTRIYIKNDAAANSMDVFPASGDDLGEGVDTVLALAAGDSVTFVATAANSTWTKLISAPAGGAGDVSKVGTPVNNEIGVWTGDGTLEGDTNLQWSGSRLTIAASGLILPAGSAGSPSVVFTGSLGTGIYAVSDVISTSIVGVEKWRTTATVLESVSTGGALVFTSSVTAPGLLPNANDSNTGIGANGSDDLTAIAGGIEGQRWNETNAGVIVSYAHDASVTAFATGGQSGATDLIHSYSVVDVVATTGDSVRLRPSFLAGSIQVIKNDAANACDVFPNTGDDLGAGANTAVSLSPGQSITFIATVDNTTWTELIPQGGATFPLEATDGSAAAPSYTFSASGQQDVGFYRASTNRIGVSVGNDPIFEFDDANSGVIQSENAGGPAMRNVAASGTAPTLLPVQGDTNTGIGQAANDTLTIVAGGIEAASFEDPADLSATETTMSLYDDDTGATVKVTVGANDSGGSGFKVLRIPN